MPKIKTPMITALGFDGKSFDISTAEITTWVHAGDTADDGTKVDSPFIGKIPGSNQVALLTDEGYCIAISPASGNVAGKRVLDIAKGFGIGTGNTGGYTGK